MLFFSEGFLPEQHTKPFYSSLDFGTTRVSWYQKVHFAVFWIFWGKMKITQTDTPTIWMDCHPIQTNWCPHLCHPTIFTPDGLHTWWLGFFKNKRKNNA